MELYRAVQGRTLRSTPNKTKQLASDSVYNRYFKISMSSRSLVGTTRRMIRLVSFRLLGKSYNRAQVNLLTLGHMPVLCENLYLRMSRSGTLFGCSAVRLFCCSAVRVLPVRSLWAAITLHINALLI